MATRQIKWSSLFNLPELDFIPDRPQVLEVSDELLQTISWLTGVTRHDRRLLRCTEQGALLIGNAWDLLESIATDELIPDDSFVDSYTNIPTNQGILVSTGDQIIKASFVRYKDEDAQDVYIPAYTLYFWPYPTYSVSAGTVPFSPSSASYVGITVFK